MITTFLYSLQQIQGANCALIEYCPQSAAKQKQIKFYLHGA